MILKFNEKGKGTYEFLTVAVTCLLLSTIFLSLAINNNNKEKMQVFKHNAKVIGINAVNYNSRVESDVIYLYELIDKQFVTNIKNNFSSYGYCDKYESKVVFTDNTKKVTLRCGEYLIYNQDITAKDYDIYKVDDWTYNKISGDNVDESKVYGIFSKGKNLLDDFYEEDLFIKMVASKYGDKYYSLENIEKDFEVASKTAYRKRVLVH